LLTWANQRKLYAEWARYWNTSKPVLVEKSPTHALRMRLLQTMFNADRSFFLVILRHPLATMRDRYQLHEGKRFLDCGDYQIRHWLLIQQSMFADLERIKNKLVVHYEDFALYGDAQGPPLL
jgi:hypothetical protein